MRTIIFIAVACTALAQDYESVCARVKSLPLPAADKPTASEKLALANCDSSDLYFGLTHPRDPVKARKCAYIEYGAKNEPVIGGRTMLMMIYANGVGGARNLDTALKFACEIEGAPAEMSGRIHHLTDMRKQHWTGSDFSVCDDITSGYMMGFCAHLQSRLDSRARNARFAALIGKWNDAEKAAYQILDKVVNEFVEAKSLNEVDMTGTARAALQIGEESTLRNEYLAALQSFDAGKLPRFTPADFTKADAELNAVYGKIMKAAELNAGTVTKDGIRKTQIIWIRYRDAWVAFGNVKYPAVTAESWKTLFTRERIKQLKALLD